MARSFSDALLGQVRAMPLAQALEGLKYHIAVDRDFTPSKDGLSQRWIVSGTAGSSELVVTGAKWYDKRAERGGGGSIDLVMHLEELSFVNAVKRLAAVLQG